MSTRTASASASAPLPPMPCVCIDCGVAYLYRWGDYERARHRCKVGRAAITK